MTWIVSIAYNRYRIKNYFWKIKEWQRSELFLKCEHDLLMIVYAYKLACIILRLFCSSLWGSVSLKLNIYTTYNLLYPHILNSRVLIHWCVFRFKNWTIQIFSRWTTNWMHIFYWSTFFTKVEIDSLIIQNKFEVIKKE